MYGHNRVPKYSGVGKGKTNIYKYTFNKPRKLIKSGVSIKNAQKYCSSPVTKGKNWFAGYQSH